MFKEEVPTVILSGGKSRRMDGNDKAFISIGDKTLLEMIVKRLERQTSEIAINTNSNSHRYTGLGLPILNDEIKGFLGPLAGIFTAMKWAKDIGYKEVATVAVDTPMFPENLLKKLYQEMKVSNSDVIFASSAVESECKKVLHPVFGLWKTNLLDDLRSEIEKGVRKVTLWSAKHKASIVCFPHELIDPFFNVNTPEDIIFLKEYLKNK